MNTNQNLKLNRVKSHRSCAALILTLAFSLISGCAVTPTSIVKTTTTAKPEPRVPMNANNGSIYNSAGYRPIFEDRRPRMVGDIVTVNLVENTSATKAGGSSGTKKGSVNSSISALFNKAAPKATMTGSSDLSNQDTSAANASNVFTGSITTTVIDVLPNGNLQVSGEKQIALDKGTEFVRFSGVVNPDTVTAGNNVSSTQVADVRLEYRTNSTIDASEVASIVTRFFLSLAPL